MRTQKSSRWAAMLLATVVGIITCMTVANATQTITTPNAANITFSLAGGANSAAITPVANKPVSVIACSTMAGNQSVGQVSLEHIPSMGTILGYITWVGLESPNGLSGGASITWGPSSTANTHIVYIDLSHLVDIQLGGAGTSGDTILIHNGATATMAGNVTLVW